MIIPDNFIVKVGFWNIKDPLPKHDFSVFQNSIYENTFGLVAASQKQLDEQIKSKIRLEPNAQEIRYFYYEVNNDGNTNKISSTEQIPSS